MLNYLGLMEFLEAVEWDDASYDSYDSDTTQIFDENDLLVVIPPAAVGCRRAGSWPPKLPCGHEFVSIK